MGENFLVELSIPPEDQVSGIQHTCIQLLERSEFVDCTLCCHDGQVQAHRILLASASRYLHNLLSNTQWPTPCSHPMLFFKTATVDDMKLALTFMYTGKVKVCKNRLAKLMDISHDLGCISLSKAIESVEVEASQKRTNQSQVNLKSKSSRPFVQTSPQSKGQLGVNHSPASNTNGCRNQKLVQESLKTKRPKSSTTSESSDDQSICMSAQEIKNESSEFTESDSSPTSSQSILRNTLTPPPPLRRTMPAMLPAPGVKKQKLECPLSHPGSRSSSQEDNLSLVEVIMLDENEDAVPEEDEFIQNEELPITVIDLKNLAEAEHVDSTLTMDDDDMFGTHSAPEKVEVLPANCPWCLQVFTSLTLLQRHIKTHVGNYKPYACDYCSATFARSAHLKRHIRTHTGEKPFICAICEKAFSRQDKLKTHLERHLQVSNNTSNGTNQQSLLKAGLLKTQQRLSPNQRIQVNDSANYTSEIGQFLSSNNSIASRNWVLSPAASRSLRDNQFTVTTSSVSPSTTITPVSGGPLDYGFMNQVQMPTN